jgi:hypothetical protein
MIWIGFKLLACLWHSPHYCAIKVAGEKVRQICFKVIHHKVAWSTTKIVKQSNSPTYITHLRANATWKRHTMLRKKVIAQKGTLWVINMQNKQLWGCKKTRVSQVRNNKNCNFSYTHFKVMLMKCQYSSTRNTITHWWCRCNISDKETIQVNVMLGQLADSTVLLPYVILNWKSIPKVQEPMGPIIIC